MAYTVKKLSELSGVSIRTLHFYEEIDLLKPAYYAGNGYRYYEEKELLQLQQILFFKELGLKLKQIRNVLGKSDFDQIKALHSHKAVLAKEKERLEKLLKTIDATIKHLKGQETMSHEWMYEGFITKEKQEEYLEYLKNKLGKDHPSFEESEKNIQKFSKEEWERSQKEMDVMMKTLASLMKKGYLPESPDVQALIKQHYRWIKKFWTPTRDSYIGLGLGYTGFEWKSFFKAYDSEHPRLASYLATGMKVFAECCLQ